MAQGGLTDKMLDGNRTLEVMDHLLRVLGINDEDGVVFWERVVSMRKNRRNWPAFQRQQFDRLNQWLEEFIQDEMKRLTPMPQEMTQIRGGHKRETLLRVYENALAHLKEFGGWHGDHGGRELAAKLKAKTPRKKGKGMRMMAAKQISDALGSRLDILERKTVKELKPVLIGQIMEAAPPLVDLSRPLSEERLEDFPKHLWADFEPEDLVAKTKARGITDRHQVARRKEIRRAVRLHATDTGQWGG